MSNKRKLPIILGTCAATVFAAGGSIFLTDTALSLLDRQTQNVREAQTEQGAKETELPITVEQFAKTDDAIEILPAGASGQEKTPETESERPTEKDTDQSEKKETEKQTETDKTPQRETQSAAETEGAASETESTERQTETTSILPGTMYARSDVYVRSSAGTDGEILGVVSEGEGVMATGNKQGNWIEVNYNGKTGYVGGSYLSSGSENSSGGSAGTQSGATGTNGTNGATGGSNGSDSGSSGSAVIPVNGTMYATAGVNVRSGPGSDYDRLGAVNTGESVGVTGDTYGNWTEVVYDGQRGYIYSGYLVWDPNDLSDSGSGGSQLSGAWDDSYLYDVSSYYCDESEFDGWSASDLAYLRNEIFARHGRIFDSERYREYFSQKTWYSPTYDPSYFDANLDSFLNDYEWANLKLIQKLEDARY